MARRFLRHNLPLLSNHELPTFTLINPMDTILELEEIETTDDNMPPVLSEESTIPENLSSPHTVVEMEDDIIEAKSPSLHASPKSMPSITDLSSLTNNDEIEPGPFSEISETLSITENAGEINFIEVQPSSPLTNPTDEEIFSPYDNIIGSRESSPSEISIKSSVPFDLDNLEERYDENFSFESVTSSQPPSLPPSSPTTPTSPKSAHTMSKMDEDAYDEIIREPIPTEPHHTTSGLDNAQDVPSLTDPNTIIEMDIAPSSTPTSPTSMPTNKEMYEVDTPPSRDQIDPEPDDIAPSSSPILAESHHTSGLDNAQDATTSPTDPHTIMNDDKPPSQDEVEPELMDVFVESAPSSPLPTHSTDHTIIDIEDLSPSNVYNNADSGRPLSPEIPLRIRRRSLIGTRGGSMELPLQPPPTPPNTAEEEKEYKGWKELGDIIPGIKQSMEAGLPWYWRLFWIVVWIAAATFVGILITLGIGKAMSHSVIVTWETEEINTAHIPFPCVAFGSQGGFEGDFTAIIDYFENGLSQIHYNDDYIESLWTGILTVVDQLCDYMTTYGGSVGIKTNQSTDLAKSPMASRMKFVDSGQISEQVKSWIEDVMISCEDLVDSCRWGGIDIDCSKIFRTVFTEHGSTCVFNGIPDAVRKRYETLQTRLGHKYTKDELDEWKDVDMDSDARNINERASGRSRNKKFPMKQLVPGQTTGLSFVLKQRKGSNNCVHTEGTGFRIGVNHPSQEVQLRRFGRTIPLGHEVLVEIVPVLTLADDDIKKIPPKKRGCYLADEFRLNFYEKYTQQNCFAECIADNITAEVGCGIITSPGKDGRNLCNPIQMISARNWTGKMYQDGLNLACPQCLPNCNNFKYGMQITSTPIDALRLEGFNTRMNSTEYIPTIVHMYFGPDAIRPNRLSERYTWFELFGLASGLVSLLGLSLINTVEILVKLRKLERPTPKLNTWVILLIAKLRIWCALLKRD